MNVSAFELRHRHHINTPKKHTGLGLLLVPDSNLSNVADTFIFKMLEIRISPYDGKLVAGLFDLGQWSLPLNTGCPITFKAR